MKAEQILQKTAKKRMIHWDVNDFKKTHPALYKTIIESINKALSIGSVSKSFYCKTGRCDKIKNKQCDECELVELNNMQ